ncbi:hypothetical protein I0C86_38270 [Plantactinospora sp. S1510]|uniref:DUF222 domain-containing protein n=1 Tax=Plantactinospora alkalitolerans TaxID=2789879 RepID=A0ABS0H8E0_9ACTN|nr:hypothetical protein [Plantactinospora alkalitolerans]MBF9134736.1 hypothetical protein [Plantactinospora alkalitolerans]
MTSQALPDDISGAVQAASDSLSQLAAARPEVAVPLARLISVVADEAIRTGRFATALQRALASDAHTATAAPVRRSGRRAPGVLDPFAVFAERGEAGLRSTLAELDLEQLRDIVAEHGMDHDRLAMKWKDSSRVVDRIIEKVEARTAKGSAFRQVSN